MLIHGSGKNLRNFSPATPRKSVQLTPVSKQPGATFQELYVPTALPYSSSKKSFLGLLSGFSLFYQQSSLLQKAQGHKDIKISRLKCSKNRQNYSAVGRYIQETWVGFFGFAFFKTQDLFTYITHIAKQSLS